MSMKGQRTLAYVVLIILTFFCLFWFYVLFINATRSNGALKKGFTAIPGGQLITNWKNLLAGTLPVWNGMFNSIFIATCSAVLCTYFSTMTAYAIHAYDFKGKKFMFTFILAVMMIPTQVTALGFLQLLGKMHLDDSFIPLIIPAIAVQAIFTFVQSWNNYFIPALVLHSDKKKTLPVLIAQLRSADFLKFDMGQVYVMIAFSIFPVIIVYILLSRFIVEGVSAGAVKG